MKASIIGASGYAGGELLRLLLQHPHIELQQVTSERNVGKPVVLIHPNLRKHTELQFTSISQLEPVDLVFVALPHCRFMNEFDKISGLAERIIDLSADFRLKNPNDYTYWYNVIHTRPEFLPEFVYGIVELHREQMKNARYISSAGCNATAVILPLYPLVKNQIIDPNRSIVVETKCGSSEGGNAPSDASHHPERSGCVRSYKPTGHRHIAEMKQELGVNIHFSATSIEMVRGILMTAHVFLKQSLSETDIWKIYRKEYDNEPFIRIVKTKAGLYRYPEPKILSGSNYCDIGFELDSDRLVVISAIDNLMKGAAGQAVHAMNIMYGFDERIGLEFMGLHPI
jgi:N-acetyl-gamma-glutamyl-phosphate/LysW-gamma-L-alpha-aminoadipyl-6-phosphate reductase